MSNSNSPSNATSTSNTAINLTQPQSAVDADKLSTLRAAYQQVDELEEQIEKAKEENKMLLLSTANKTIEMQKQIDQ